MDASLTPALALVTDLLLRPLLFAALLGLAFFPLEQLLALREARAAASREVWKDVAFASAGQVVVRVGLVFALGPALSALEDHGLASPLFSAIANQELRAVIEVLAGLLLFELGGYAYHRLAHRVPCLWRMHELHHSSTHMDWLASFRQHPLEIVLMTFLQNAPLVWCGIPLGAHTSVLVLLKLHTVFVHANLRVRQGAWSEVIATPAFHHRHHDRDGAPKNFAALFPWLDRVFGTHSAQQASAFGLQSGYGLMSSIGAAKKSSTSLRRAIVSA